MVPPMCWQTLYIHPVLAATSRERLSKAVQGQIEGMHASAESMEAPPHV